MFKIDKLDSGYKLKFYDQFNNKVYIALSENTVTIDRDNYIVFFDGYIYNSDVSSEILFQESLNKEILKRFGCFTVVILNKAEYKLTVYSDSLGLAQNFMHIANNNCYYISCEIKNFKKLFGLDISIDLNEIIRNPWFSGIPKNDIIKRDIFNGVIEVAFKQIMEFTVNDTLDFTVANKEIFNNLQCVKENLEDVQEYYEKKLESAVVGFKPLKVALLLSGGIDSVTVGKMLDNSKIDYFAVSLVSESTLSNEDVLYSSKFSNIQNKDCKMIELLEDSPLLSVEQYKQLLSICESPFVGAEQIYKYLLYYSINENYSDTEFIATGQGSDEFNGGYSSTAGNDWEDFNNFMSFLHTHANIEDSYIWTERFQENIFNSKGNVFEEYTKGKLNNFLYYGVWNEIRIAKHFGFKIFSPFLHVDFYNLTKVTPSYLQKELYFDKKILRKYAEKIGVPNEFVNRGKTPFFHGHKTNVTYKNLFNIVNQDSKKLVYDAFKDKELCNTVSLNRIIKILDDMEDLDDYSNIEYILKLINVGLLNQFLCEEKSIESNIESVKIIADGAMFLRDSLLETKTMHCDFELSEDSEILFSYDLKLISILKNGNKLFEVEKDHSEIFYSLLKNLGSSGKISIGSSYSSEVLSWLGILKEEKILVVR
ncbi:asparagine synthase-related protein [Streptococcus sp.]